MSEVMPAHEAESDVALIARGLERWLNKEVGNSTMGRNAYLDDYNQFQRDLGQPYDTEQNDNAQKNRSHHNRLMEWTSDLTQYYDLLTPGQRDEALARQIFCAQMYLSGLFRVQCMMQARDQEDYYDRRLSGSSAGIDLKTEIQAALGNHTNPYIMRELARKTLGINQRQQDYVRRLHESGRFDVGKEQSPTIDRITGLQKEWTKLIIDYVLFAAYEHAGDLEKVPFLEPKSISDDPQVYYPFVRAS